MGDEQEGTSPRGHPFDDLGELSGGLFREHQFSPPAEACSSGPFLCPPESGGGPVHVFRLPSFPHGTEEGRIGGIHGDADGVRSGGKKRESPLVRQKGPVRLESDDGLPRKMAPGRFDELLEFRVKQGFPYAVENKGIQCREGRDQFFKGFTGQKFVRNSRPRLLDAHGAPEVARRGDLREELGRMGPFEGRKTAVHYTCSTASKPNRCFNFQTSLYTGGMARRARTPPATRPPMETMAMGDL